METYGKHMGDPQSSLDFRIKCSRYDRFTCSMFDTYGLVGSSEPCCDLRFGKCSSVAESDGAWGSEEEF